MLHQSRKLPPLGVVLFLAYGAAVLAFIGLTLRFAIEDAVTSPISLLGIVDMLLLAYSIFTITLVLQRKQAAYPLALGLASIGLTLVFIDPLGWFALATAVVVLIGLRRQSSRDWFTEP